MRCLSKEERRKWPEQAIRLSWRGEGGGGQEWCIEGEGNSGRCLKWGGQGH